MTADPSEALAHYNPNAKPHQMVPGALPAVGKMDHETAKFREEIKKKSLPELKELLVRQKGILKNTKVLKNLPDKGEKVERKRDEIEVTIPILIKKKRIQISSFIPLQKLIEQLTPKVSATTELLANLSLNGKKVDTDELEWKFGGGGIINKAKIIELDSDDDYEPEEPKNPLKVLVEGSVPPKAKKTIVQKVTDIGDSLKLTDTRFMPFNALKVRMN